MRIEDDMTTLLSLLVGCCIGTSLEYVCTMQYLRHTYFKNPIIFVIYQILKFNWVSYILSGNATRSLDTSSELQGSKSVPMDR